VGVAPLPLELPLNLAPTCASVLALPAELDVNPCSPSVGSSKGEGTYAGTGFRASLFPVDAPEFLRERGGFTAADVRVGFEVGLGLGYAEGGPCRALGSRGTFTDGGLPTRILPTESTDRLEYASSWDWDWDWEYECLP